MYGSWIEFAKQLLWDYQLGEAFVIATARYSTGWPARFHVVAPWLVNVEMVGGRAALLDRRRRCDRRHRAHPVSDSRRRGARSRSARGWARPGCGGGVCSAVTPRTSSPVAACRPVCSPTPTS